MRYVERGNVHDFIFEGQTDFCLEKIVGDQDSLELLVETGASVPVEPEDLIRALLHIFEIEGKPDAAELMQAVLNEIEES